MRRRMLPDQHTRRSARQTLRTLGRGCLAALALVLLAGAAAESDDAAEAAFAQCKAGLEQQALAAGLPEAQVSEVFATIERLPRAIAADRKQPEFTQTFSAYYHKRVHDRRVQRGRALIREHRTLLQRVERSTGIPAQYLVALWGLETNFGSYFGTLFIPSALATLACDARRSEFFTRELLSVLRIVADGDLEPEQLTGSWAGAMGHMQFMPSTFVRYAVDADADGRRDLYGSIEDALWSAANYLASMGWQPGYRWGREVLLPEGFDYSLTGADRPQPLSFWRAQGVTDVFDQRLPDLDLTSALLLPTGYAGPAFIVYPNFDVIMQWNRSESYALSVGRLADRIAGAGRLAVALPSDEDIALPTADLKELQRNLAELGFDPGGVDGVLGPATRGAIRAFQISAGLVADGYPRPAVVEAAADARTALADSGSG